MHRVHMECLPAGAGVGGVAAAVAVDSVGEEAGGWGRDTAIGREKFLGLRIYYRTVKGRT